VRFASREKKIRIIKSSHYFEKLKFIETVYDKGLSRLNNLSKGANDQRNLLLLRLLSATRYV
jgi:hypothetical protein